MRGITLSFFPLILAGVLGTALSVPALDVSKVPAVDWIQIFNGKNLTDWVPKIKGTVAGQDPLNTWYVKDSLLWADYKGYGGQFNGRYGHLAYQKRKFSYYLFHVESNVWGVQTPGGAGWAKQNNGVMYHSQSMESMGLNQEFPDCFEYQLLGPDNGLNTTQPGNGTTANMCGNGNSALLNGSRQSPQCYNAKHVQIDSTHWVVTEGLVLGDSIVKHMVSGDPSRAVDTVMTYTKLQHSGTNAPVTNGYIAIQGESTPWKFKVIKVLDLEGCTDPKYASYRSYFIKSNPAACTGTVALHAEALPGDAFIWAGTGEIRIFTPLGPYRAEAYAPSGELLGRGEIVSGGEFRLGHLPSGLVLLKLAGAGKSASRVVAVP